MDLSFNANINLISKTNLTLIKINFHILHLKAKHLKILSFTAFALTIKILKFFKSSFSLH
jgi:hypothetical protein